MQRHTSNVRGRRVGVLVMGVLALLAASCGGGDDDDPAANGGTVGQSANTEAACRPGFDVEDPDAGDEGLEPEYGGTLVYGLEAETDGWYGPSNRWSLSGLQVANAIYDTLAKVGADGEYYPWLAESIEHNDDYTVWTLVAREGVTFHNGEALTGEAIRESLERFRTAPLTQAALSNIDNIVALPDGLTVEVHMKEPWVPFPQYLTSQVGVVMAPAMYDLENPNENPIGTGPFKLARWERNASLLVEKNEDYWATDAEGNQLPFLDAIEFRPIPDPLQRKNALDSGDIQVMHTYTASQIEDFREEAEAGTMNAYESCAWGEDEEFLLMFNSGAEPFNDRIAREAVSRAIDRRVVIENLFGDTFQVATGPYAPGSPWYSEPPEGTEDTLYDPERARELVAEYEEKHGKPLSFSIGAPSSIPEALESQQLMGTFLEEVGIEVQLEQLEFAQYLVNALAGRYDANIWRQFGAPDPDGDYVWWHPDNVKPVDESSLNIARFKDEEMGEALDRGRQSDDPEVRRQAYADVQRIFREQFYLGWSAHAFWSLGTAPEVHDLVDWTVPSGEQGMPLVGGQHPMAQVWLEL